MRVSLSLKWLCFRGGRCTGGSSPLSPVSSPLFFLMQCSRAVMVCLGLDPSGLTELALASVLSRDCCFCDVHRHYDLTFHLTSLLGLFHTEHCPWWLSCPCPWDVALVCSHELVALDRARQQRLPFREALLFSAFCFIAALCPIHRPSCHWEVDAVPQASEYHGSVWFQKMLEINIRLLSFNFVK